MGIRNLWEIVSSSRQKTSLETLSYQHFLRTGKFFKLGVDISIWLSQCQIGLKGKHIKSHTQLGPNPELRTMFLRVSRISQLPIVLLAVFDGPRRPDRKRNTIVRMTPHWMVGGTRDILQTFGHFSITAPGEAEAELAYLNREGYIDAVLTDDSDVLVFGAQTIIRNPEDRKHPDTVFIYNTNNFGTQSQTPIMRDGLLLFALLQGGDYSKGIKGCGKVTAYALTNTSLGTMLRFAAEDLDNAELRQYLDEEWTPALKHEIQYDPHSFIGSKCSAVAANIPAKFPDVTTVRNYISPLTSPSFASTNLPGIADLLDVSGIGVFCNQLFLWGSSGVIMDKFESSVWPCMCIRKLIKGQTDHLISITNIKSTSNGIVVRVTFDIIWLVTLTASRLSGVSATHPQTVIKMWLPAVLIDSESSFVDDFLDSLVLRAQTLSVMNKIQLLHSAYGVLSANTVPPVNNEVLDLTGDDDVAGEYPHSSSLHTISHEVIDLTMDD